MSNKKLRAVSLAVLLSLTLSLIFPVGVLADDAPPPSPEATEVVMPPEEVPTEEGIATEEPALIVEAAPTEEPVVTEEPVATEAAVATQEVSEDTGSIENDASLLGELPEGTDVVVLDESGETVTLASQEAAEILADPDPFFYIGGVKKVFTATDCNPDMAGNQGCANPIQSAIDYAKVNPPTNGTIYIEKGTYGTAAQPITVRIEDFAAALTLQGVLNASGDPIVLPGDRPTINGQIFIRDGSDGGSVGNTGNITLASLIINDNNNSSSDNPAIFASGNTANLTFTNLDLNAPGSGNSGLIVTNHTGNVFLTNVDASGTANRGASIDNTAGNSTVGVAVTDSVFNDNNSDGLYIRSDGTIILTNVIAGNANNTGNGDDGADLNNTTGNSSVGVTVTGGTFNDNDSDGLQIRSDGTITLTNVTAGNANGTGNGDDGANLDNTTGNGSVDVTGSVFNDNGSDGLQIQSDGTVTLLNAIASNNDLNGINISDATAVALNNVAAINNGTTYSWWFWTFHLGSGVLVNGTGSTVVDVINGGTFSNNHRYGIEVSGSTLYVQPTPTCSGNVSSCYNVTAVPIVYGCMDEAAFNYNSLANRGDGSCVARVYGCTDETALNFDELANTDDESCIARVYGCTDKTAFNFNPEANTDDESCEAVVLGCTDPTAFNYNSLANTDDGTCTPVEPDIRSRKGNAPLIPVTGGVIDLSCTAPFITVEKVAGFEVTFTSLCGYSATLTEGVENKVSDLPAGNKYVGGVNIALLKDGSLVEELPAGSTIELSFEIPSGMAGKTLAFLFWDSTTNSWVEKSLTVADGKATVAIGVSGNFVLVEK